MRGPGLIIPRRVKGWVGQQAQSTNLNQDGWTPNIRQVGVI